MSTYNIDRVVAGEISEADLATMIREFQRGMGLAEDGKAGPKTVAAARKRRGLPARKPSKARLPKWKDLGEDARELSAAELSVAVAQWFADAGAREKGGNNSGPWVALFHRIADDGDPDNDGNWCAAFCATVLEATAALLDRPLPVVYSRRQRGGAKALGSRWGRGRSLGPGDMPQPGDAIVWHRGAAGSWMGHIEIVAQVHADGDLTTIGGNASGFRKDGGRVRRLRREDWRDRLRGVYASSWEG